MRVEGELARIMETQYGEAVRDAVAARTQELAEKKAAAESPESLSSERRRFRRSVRQLTEQPRTKVVVTYVEALDETAQPLSLDEARALRRDFQRKLADRRGTATARAISAAQAARIAAPSAESAEASPALADDAEAAPTEARRPRRRPEATATPSVEEPSPAATMVVIEAADERAE